MSRFFIKQISVTGEKVLFSEVSFNDGVNIIYGPSNAGKSYIINCINFMFAGDPPFTKSSTGYDTVRNISFYMPSSNKGAFGIHES